MTARYDYRRWDGSQDFADFDADDLLAGLTDDLLAGGSLDDAMRRLLRGGMRTSDGREVPGLRDMLERLRRRREELLSEGDPDGEMARVAERLEEILDEERGAIDDLEQEARDSGDQRRSEVTEGVTSERRLALDLLPDDLSGRVRSLQHYEFISSEAREHFEELMEELREEVARTYFENVSEALQSFDPEQMRRMRDALDALNRMLEQREHGEALDPSFQDFMDQFGDLFPGDPQSLDELLEQLAQRMAAAEAMFRSLSPEQQAQLRELAETLLEDMDLRWQLDRLASNLQRAVPQAGWDRAYGFQGDQPMGMAQATDLASQLGELDRMEEIMRSAASPAALSEVDLDQVRRHLGDDTARALDRLARLARTLQEEGLIEQRGSETELTPKGVRRIGQRGAQRSLLADGPRPGGGAPGHLVRGGARP